MIEKGLYVLKFTAVRTQTRIRKFSEGSSDLNLQNTIIRTMIKNGFYIKNFTN